MSPASKDVQGEARAQLVLFGPPAGQFEKGPMLVLRGNSVEEAVELAAEFFDSETVIDDLRAIFDLKRATAIVAAAFDAQPVEEPESVKTTVKPTNISEAPSAQSGTTCPECGKGKLREREGKYGTFTGCSAFPNCKYVVKRGS